MGKPSGELSEYSIQDVDGVSVYIRNDVQANEEGIKIKYAKILFKESLIVEGVVV